MPEGPAPQVNDPLPEELQLELDRFAAAGLAHVPRKRRRKNLLIGTWNLREFGGLTEKWRSTQRDVPKRDLYSIRCIAEVVKRFDIVALQEVQRDIKALRFLLRVLGPEWAFILTDVTEGERGQNERLAFLFDTRRVKPSGLACELVVPEELLKHNRRVKKDAMDRQFARTPYAVSFQSAGQTFILVTLHIYFGKKKADRTGELAGIAAWMADWARRVEEFNQNLICLGDFNIDQAQDNDPNYEAFVNRGLTPAPELNQIPRTLPLKSEKPKFYDQIAWFTDKKNRARLRLDYHGSGGSAFFDQFLFPGLQRGPLSYRISDHYPLWAEFLVPLGAT